MEYVVFDQDSIAGARELAISIRERFPKLNVLVNNAGIQRVEDLTSGDVSDSEATPMCSVRCG